MTIDNSIKPSASNKPAKPSKPYTDFPLTAHPAGYWCKKIRGKLYYFGPWDDPDAALQKYLDQKDALHAGRKPRQDPNALTIKQLCNEFLNAKQPLVDSGELKKRTWEEYRKMCILVINHFGKGRLVDDLMPDDFAELRSRMAKRLSATTLANRINRIRVVFNFAMKNGLVDKSIRFGDGFKKPSKKTLRLERASRGIRMFEADELRQLINTAKQPLKAMILLGINAGFGNTDCATVPMTAVNLENGWMNYHRPKTGIDRRVPLWAETVEAIRDWLARRPKAKSEADANLLFLTKYRTTWDKGSDNPLSKEMKKLLNSLEINGNRNFYALRHTFETIAGESKDQVAVDAIMGHARDDMASVYRERISDERLAAVADVVRNWLFGETENH